MINDFHGKYFFLSNFAESAIVLDGVLYPTVEHAFQAAKMVNESDRLAISRAKTPGQAKRIGRSGLMRSDWEEIKVEVMHQCLLRKFLLNPFLREKLRETGDEELVEGNTWHDNCWGDCFCPKCANKPGLNHLGRLLMEIRDNDKADKYFFTVGESKDGEVNVLRTFSSPEKAVSYVQLEFFDETYCGLSDKYLHINTIK